MDELPSTRALQLAEPSTDVIVGIDFPAEARRWLLVNSVPIVEDGAVVGAITSYSGITDQVRQGISLNLMLEVNRIVMLATDEENFLQRICEVLVEVGGHALVAISEADNDGNGGVEVRHAAGLTELIAEWSWSWSGSEPKGHGASGTTLRTGEVVVSNDVASDPSMEEWSQLSTKFGIGSIAAIPLDVVHRRAVLTLMDSHPNAFDEGTTAGLRQIAEEVAFCAGHVRSLERLARSLDGTISALSLASEALDPMAAGHQVQVAALSAAIARELALDDKLVEGIRQAAMVHDVGLIGTPEGLLGRSLEAGSPEERLFRMHPTAGATILNGASLPWPIPQVALEHHERMDGSGYPRGLTGGEICLPSRIVAVADEVEAITQTRSNRNAAGLAQALAKIRAGSGRLFDPDVVRACCAVFDEGFRVGGPRVSAG
jgi:HD-GYP domain-containing protein (c-di-GMP phosphodiesterase class II)